MKFPKASLLALTMMTCCFTHAVSAQTSASVDVSADAKLEKADTASGHEAVGPPSTSGDSGSAISTGATIHKPAAEPNTAPRTQAASSDEWQFTIAPYLFLAGMSGDIGVNNLSTEIDASAGDILDALDFGFMAAFEARKNRFFFLTDLMYANLQKDRALAGPLFSAVEAEATMFLFSPQVGYRLVEREASSLDALVGVRIWHTSHRLTFEPGLLAGRSEEGSKNWADVIAGLRGQAHLTKRFFVHGRVDLGGGGSDFTYQLLGAVGFDVADRVSLLGGYRYLHINYDRDGFLFDGALRGLLLGAMFRF